MLYSDITYTTSDSPSFKELQSRQGIRPVLKYAYISHILQLDINLAYLVTEQMLCIGLLLNNSFHSFYRFTSNFIKTSPKNGTFTIY